MLSRRRFLFSTTVTGCVSSVTGPLPLRESLISNAGTSALGSQVASSQDSKRVGVRPLVISSDNGIRAVEKAMSILKAGGSTLDAVIEGVTLVEDDPEDSSVGLGGLPNSEGEVELDASVMHGPTGAAGAVGALKFIRNPAKVARLVMERSNRVFLVGEGALRFALAHGFQKENLLT